jgi:hypothetical protein
MQQFGQRNDRHPLILQKETGQPEAEPVLPLRTAWTYSTTAPSVTPSGVFYYESRSTTAPSY